MREALARLQRVVKAWFVTSLALVLLVAGLILFPFPIPLGLPLIVIGLALLISSSDASAELMTRIRRRYPRFDAALRRTEPKIPGWLRAPIRKTDPLLQDSSADAARATHDDTPSPS
ncbi:MAG: hypothetical protein AAF184_02300 [Pseudomonadota bacterium]